MAVMTTPLQLRWHERRHVWMHWNGWRWAKAIYAPRPARLTEPAPFGPADEVGDGRRARLLARAVESEVFRGAVVHDRSEHSAVVGYLRPVSHTAHLLATVLTGGLWGVVWIAMACARREDRVLMSVDRYGNVWGWEG